METYTIEDIKNEVYGEIGTLRRDKIETELSNLRVGLQIRNAREARKMTQNELAGKIGKERSFISKVERDGSNLTLSTLYDIVTKGLGGKLDIQVQL
ncbi:helix-turn-helix transcriptional regulator [Bacteroides uniformis]|uniref:helix-turn-helix domain-containing protein n=1 Tax=Bacteroides uniformis TaxID=820 RepID=UPI0039B62A7F